MNGLMVLALATAWAGCASIYLASPNQRLRPAPWPARTAQAARAARAAGVALLLISLLSFGQAMLALTAVFAFVTCVMLGFALLPYLGALRNLPGGR